MTNFWLGIPVLIVLIGAPIFALHATPRMEIALFAVVCPAFLFLIGAFLVFKWSHPGLIFLGAFTMWLVGFYFWSLWTNRAEPTVR